MKKKNGGSRETGRDGTFFKRTEELSFKRGRLQKEKNRKKEQRKVDKPVKAFWPRFLRLLKLQG